MHDLRHTVRTQDTAVNASPFTAVKLELGIILFLGALLWLAADSITADSNKQLLMFAIFSVSSMVILVVHTRRILKRMKFAVEQQHTDGTNYET